MNNDILIITMLLLLAFGNFGFGEIEKKYEMPVDRYEIKEIEGYISYLAASKKVEVEEFEPEIEPEPENNSGEIGEVLKKKPVEQFPQK